ncbi:MAG: hypothetical protein AAFN93_08825 [Bacteroidota bacterium]
MSEVKFYLNYQFDSDLSGTDFQTIYVAHIHGTTFAIGARFKILKEVKEGIKKLRAEFQSRVMGGTINFEIREVNPEIDFDEGSVGTHEMDIRLNFASTGDDIINPIELTFEKPFNLENDELLIIIPDEKIMNLRPEMLNTKTRSIDDDRSCLVKLGGG